MKDVVSNVQNIQNALKQLKLPNDLQNSFKKTFGDLERELEKYQKLMAGGFKTKGDANAMIDDFYVVKDNLMGKVLFKIKYIGKPTLWLRKVFDKEG